MRSKNREGERKGAPLDSHGIRTVWCIPKAACEWRSVCRPRAFQRSWSGPEMPETFSRAEQLADSGTCCFRHMIKRRSSPNTSIPTNVCSADHHAWVRARIHPVDGGDRGGGMWRRGTQLFLLSGHLLCPLLGSSCALLWLLWICLFFQDDLRKATIIPWGFVSQQRVLETITPERVAGAGGADGGKVDKRAEHLHLDSWEFLRVRCWCRWCVAIGLPPRSYLQVLGLKRTARGVTAPEVTQSEWHDW